MWLSKTKMPTADSAIPGRADAIMISGKHFISGNTIVAPFPPGIELAYFGMGCF